MGNTVSYSDPEKITPLPGGCNHCYRCSIIDDSSINYVLSRHAPSLSVADKAMLQTAQGSSVSEIGDTMRNCELAMYLDSGTVIFLRSGDCKNRIVLRRGDKGTPEWIFAQEGKIQKVYTYGKWIITNIGSIGTALVAVFGTMRSNRG